MSGAHVPLFQLFPTSCQSATRGSNTPLRSNTRLMAPRSRRRARPMSSWRTSPCASGAARATAKCRRRRQGHLEAPDRQDAARAVGRLRAEIRLGGEGVEGEIGAAGLDHRKDAVIVLHVDQLLQADGAQRPPILDPAARRRRGQPAQLLDRASRARTSARLLGGVEPDLPLAGLDHRRRPQQRVRVLVELVDQTVCDGRSSRPAIASARLRA